MQAGRRTTLARSLITGKMESNSPLAEPPEGVVSGNSIPRENELNGIEEQMIQEAVGIMKTKEAYERMDDNKLGQKTNEVVL